MIDKLLCTRGNDNVQSFTELIFLEVFQHSSHVKLISDRLRNWRKEKGSLEIGISDLRGRKIIPERTCAAETQHVD